MPIRLFLLWLAEELVRLAFWRSPVSHVGMTLHDGGDRTTITTTLLPDFGLEDYRRAIRFRPGRDGASKQMPLPRTMEKPPRRPSDVEALTDTLSH